MGKLQFYSFLAFSICLLSLNSCSVYPTEEDLIDEMKGAVYAASILHDTVRITDLFSSEGDTRYETDDQGRITVLYNGSVLTEDADVVAPPIIGFGDIEISDTVFVLNYGLGSPNTIDSAVILKDKIQFKFENTIDEPINVRIWVEEMVKDGIVLEDNVVVPPSGGIKSTFKGDKIDMSGYSILGNDNKMTFKYDARKANGDRVKLNKVFGNFNLIQFEYLQGYFPKTIKPVEGNFVPVGLYDNWVSGTMEFEDPKVFIGVNNSFGFPVGAKFNTMSLISIDDQQYDLESLQLEEGIDFNYPALDEIGDQKYTSFYFDKNNSNLPLIFENKIKRLDYNIEAIANPKDIQDFIGFLTKDSYYEVQLSVEIPMHLKINNLVLKDTLDFSLNQGNKIVDSLELKLIIENTYPVDVVIDATLLDEMGNPIQSLFGEEGLELQAANTTDLGEVLSFDKNISYYTFSESNIDEILKAKSMVVQCHISTVEKYDEPIWLYDTYGVTIKSGAKFSLK